MELKLIGVCGVRRKKEGADVEAIARESPGMDCLSSRQGSMQTPGRNGFATSRS